MVRYLHPLLWSLLLGICIVGFGVPEAEAQSRRSQKSTPQQAAPSSQQAPSTSPSGPAGTEVPSATRSASPSQRSGRTSAPGQAQKNTSPTPGPPTQGQQVPLGGAEWLAAAGAAYALNRLRKENGDDEDDSDDTP